MKSPILKYTLWTVGIAVLAAAAWLVLRPPAVPCDIATADVGPLTVTVDENGRTRLKDRYIVSAPLAGRAERMTLRPGDKVIAGDTVLVAISPTEPALLDERARSQAQARVHAAEAALARVEPDLASAKDRLAHATSEHRRVSDAFERGASSAVELEDTLLNLRTSQNTHDALHFSRDIARYELDQAQAALVQSSGTSTAVRGGISVFEVRSPITGSVLRVMRESAGVVAPGDGLLELGSLDALEVEVDVLSDQAVRIAPGAPVSLERWGGERPLAGVVRVIEPSGFLKVSALGVEEQRVNVIIDFLEPLAARPSLGDNFRVEARIVVWTTPTTLRVPVGALFRQEDQWSVFVVRDGRAHLRHIDIGERSDRLAQVLDGLQDQESVVVFPSDRVADGVRVTPRIR